MNTYKKSEKAITTGNSFTDSWAYENDIIKQIREKMGDSFPPKHRRDVCINTDGEVFASGNPKYSWYLVDTTDPKNELLVASRSAIQMTSKKTGETYYMVSKFADKTK
jgi:hypothetical protein